ncbi:MAG: NAD(P)(+) transhydrogenase (Re/Si-specific) subunit beta, partial [Nocardioidaceae bacterium]
MSETTAQLFYLVAAVCFILALRGLSSPKTARNGNLIGAAGAILATVTVFLYGDLDHELLMLGAIAVGSLFGVVAAQRVQMTQMPQLVALFNGVGGGAAALVALLELDEIVAIDSSTDTPAVTLVATAFTVIVGAVSFSGSLVTFAKLQGLITSRPIMFPGLPVLFGGGLLAAVALSVFLVVEPWMWLGVILAVVGLAVGLLLVLPVGGADVPIVISLLNAFTGLAVAAGGYILGNTLLLIAGTLVGASGTLLTKLMASAMGRSLFNILFGALKGGSTLGGGEASDRPVRSAGPADVAILLAYADRVIVVPGYGLAVAQAQHTLRELVDVMTAKGIKVDYAIHPVAGRMPGHMNVLLAEAQVPYEQLKEMGDINGEFKQTDVVLVVGANDVVNPAAKTTPGAPIYGMPILAADEAKQVVFMKRSMRPGFAGIDNELLFDPKTTLLFGDAKDTMSKLLSAV